MSSTAYTHIGELTTNDDRVGDGTPLGRLYDAGLVEVDGRVAWLGPSAATPAADTAIDCAGAAVIPGFVDSHTHLVFAGDRAEEFRARAHGRRYDGGGIAVTVAATRAASRDALLAASRVRLTALRAGGVTTVEVKSGYALTVEGERRLVEVAAELTEECTFLGAHAVPPEFARDREGYVHLVTTSMLDACAPQCRWTDVFCDDGAFSVDEARAVLSAAAARGLGLRVHGNQLGPSGGVRLAVEVGAASVDHCTHLSNADVAALGGSPTVATLLPSADFLTGAPPAPGRRLLDAGATVALATDCNPGTSYVTSMAFVMSVAVRECHLTPDEALWSATRGGARALGRDDIGGLAVGQWADLVLLAAPAAIHLTYRPGSSLVTSVHRAERSRHDFGRHGG